jgi:hypothetical protein
MKPIFVIGLLLAAGCAPSRAPITRDTTTTTAPAPSSAARETTDCERQAALAGVGERAKAFEACMKAKNRAPAP